MSGAKEQPLLYGWGRLAAPGRELLSEDLAAITVDVPLTRGLGRSYGDASLPPPKEPVAAASRLADRILELDPDRGRLRAEAGCSLFDLNRLLWPRGWAMPVSPGTQQVTVGGMVAADIHGKNHHVAGSFGRYVRSLGMRLADGTRVECSRQYDSALFRATLGGMGLTGHILEAELELERIPSPWLEVERCRFGTVTELATALREASREWPMTAAWIDGAHRDWRGVLLVGRWAPPEDRPRRPPAPRDGFTVPMDAPSWLLNRPALRGFNGLNWLRNTDRRLRRVHPQEFLYPLDGVGEWSRLYGRRGMTQWQCVLPAEAGPEGVRKCLERVRLHGATSYLAVLKDFGAEGEGLLSFPMPGFTLALDFPVTPGTQSLIDGLNEWLVAWGGRIYLAKDAFTRPAHFRAMEREALERFDAVRERYDRERRIRSRLSVRLLGDPE
ncbi:MAG: FAD-binding oxidoreductase [Thermoanaerobaculia bacterium]